MSTAQDVVNGTAPTAALVDARDLKVELDSDTGLVRALDGVTLELLRGETFALVGESGCGKSMTALSLLRLLPENGRIAAGRVLLDGTDLLTLPESRMRDVRGARVGIIFQEPATSLNPVMRVGDQIIESIRTHTPLSGKAARARALDWLERVGLPEPARRIDDYPFQLSGGQKQRVMIAMALAAEPDVLIADEPTTALDVTIQAQILDLLKQLQAEQGMALLLITHDLGIVRQMAHRVALMYAGQIVEVASADDFFARPLHPYAQLLFQALPAAVKRGQPLDTIRGSVPLLTMEFAGCRFVDRCPQAMAHCRTVQPELIGAQLGHAVRCLLFKEDDAGDGVPQRVDVAVLADATSHQTTSPDENPPTGMRATSSTVSTVPTTTPAPTTSATTLLDVRDLTVHFPIRKGLLRRTVGYVKAVDGVSFSIEPGRTLALVGESGCGKTTIGKALLQLLRRQAVIGGDMRLDGQSLQLLNGQDLMQARRAIQIIFQDPFASLDPRMRIAEILEEGLLALRPELDAPARLRRVAHLLEQVGLRDDVLTRYPHEFSGGQRQRLAIARALAVEPRLIVCDEPTSALDVSVQAQILNLLGRLQSELGVAYLFITHNIGVVEYLAHDIAVMRAGRIVEQGPAGQVLGHPAHDYTRSLLASVPRVNL